MQILKNLFHLLNAYLANIYFGFPAKSIVVIGITGTDGKTTTTHLIYHILKSANYQVSFISSVEANIMGKSSDTGFHVTTPSPWQLQRLIREAVDAGTKYLVLEVTSHALDQFRIFAIPIKIAVITNISHEHLDYHKSLENYRRAKAKLLKGARFCVLNADDPNFSFLRQKATGKIIPFSLKKNEVSNKINNQGNPNLLGQYNQSNILAAASVALLLNIDTFIVKKAVLTFPGVPGRLEQVKNSKHLKIYIDFAHKINALDKVLETLKKITDNNLIAVFGSAGLRDHTKRPLMGEVAVKHADFVILTAEDPRTEDVRDIIAQIAQGCLRKKAMESNKRISKLKFNREKKYFFKIPDRQEAINFAIRKLARSGDTVVICGKGHEQSMCYGNIEYPWDDKKAINKALYGQI